MTVKCAYRGRGGSEEDDEEEEEEIARRGRGRASSGERDSEATYFFKGAWEKVLDECTHLYTPKQEKNNNNNDKKKKKGDNNTNNDNNDDNNNNSTDPAMDEAAKDPIRRIALTWGNIGLRVLGLAVGDHPDRLRFVGCC